MNLKFKGKYVLSGKINCVTGLHIGGSTIGIEIGGIDNPVIKDPLTEYPYIPGSSLRGKLRSLMEWSNGLIEEHKKHGGYAAYGCKELSVSRPEGAGAKKWDAAYNLARLFGAATDDTTVRIQAGPTRLIVRDAFPTQETKEKWETWLGKGIYTEVKTENALDRLTSEANPRPVERVPAGSDFAFEMLVDVYRDEDYGLFRDLFATMRLLEHSALGGSGSRGHGRVQFAELKLEWRPVDYYKTGAGAKSIDLPKQTVEGLIKDFDRIQWP